MARSTWTRGARLVLVVAAAIAGAGCRSESSAAAAGAPAAAPSAVADPLPSWHARPAKQAIVDFVRRVTEPGGAEHVPAGERIAVFDNDGTLWVEQPVYVQLAFTLDRVRELAPLHPEWQRREPFRSALAGDVHAIRTSGKQDLASLLAATHTGNTSVEFEQVVERWITSARHPRLGKRYTELVYQPMLELLVYLRRNGFKTFIVTGGGVDFVRPWAERVYGIPPEQVVGSRVELKYEVRAGQPVIYRSSEPDLINDGPGKPVGIQQVIGRRPVLAAGNSDGDFEMLEWTTAGRGARLGLIVHHTDAEREWAYDRASHVGQLQRALDEAARRGWLLVDMKRDWRVVFPVQRRGRPAPADHVKEEDRGQ